MTEHRAVVEVVDQVSGQHAESQTEPHEGPHTETEGRIRILLVDDHDLVRAGLARLIGNDPQCMVVGEASNGERALALARELRPDIVFLDISMPGTNGLEACGQIINDVPGTKVIMLSMHDKREIVASALRLGASGYVLKDAAPEELKLAVTWVLSGNKFFSRRLTIQPKSAHRPFEASTGLTACEREVLALITEGHSTDEIAARLGLSAKAVETHRAKIMSKFDIFNIGGADESRHPPRLDCAEA